MVRLSGLDNFYDLLMLHDKSRGTQVFAYRNDGEYSIDNLAAERAIRPQAYSARARCSLVVFRVHWDRQCTIPLSGLASKSESRSGNISRLCSKPWNLVERTTRTCFQWQSAWSNEIFSERNLKMRFAGFEKSPQIGALWHFWTLTSMFTVTNELCIIVWRLKI